MAKKKQGGRPSGLTPAVRQAILRAVGDGVPRKHAAEAAGVGERTLYTWLARGKREEKGEFRQFWQAFKKAEAKAVAERVRIIKRAGRKSWVAAAWWLERTLPDQFGRDRRELLDLKRQLAELQARLAAAGANSEPGGDPEAAEASGPGPDPPGGTAVPPAS